ncbi:MAG: type VI secretion system protein TssA [Pyrinomonadaceae bacterium]|nr:type VI secretion system protein TssA [Pyrinomonadaceae bacterium]MBP6213073.1 type VI secretion system protein TssA [Pyrinomonadaceae bacterium]
MSEELSTPPVIDLDAMLQPVSDDSPSGENLRYSGLYDEIVEARRSDDNLNQGEWQTELKTADYRKVIDLAVPALTSQSKDLQIAAWLSESLIKNHGFAGLRDGLKLVAGLQEQFWDTAHPIVEDNDMEGRANAISWLDVQCAAAIKTCPFTGGAGYSYNDWLDAKTFDIPANFDSLDPESQQKFNALRAQAESEGRVTGDLWKVAIAKTRRAQVETTAVTIDECWAALSDLDRVIEEKYDRNQMPGLSNLKKSIEDVHGQVKKLVEKKRLEEPDAAAPDEWTETESESGSSGDSAEFATSGGSGGPVKSRPEALKRLSEIATFFQRTEPHSPVAYLVQRAVKWGSMPLDSWLQEVIKDQTVLGQLNEMLGIGQASASSSWDESYEESPAAETTNESSDDW